MSAEQVAAQTRRLLSQTREERAALGVMHPGRVDVIGGGAMVLDQIMRRFGFGKVLVSEHDILDGIAWSLAAGGAGESEGPAGPGSGWPDDPATPDTPVAHEPGEVRVLANGPARWPSWWPGNPSAAPAPGSSSGGSR